MTCYVKIWLRINVLPSMPSLSPSVFHLQGIWFHFYLSLVESSPNICVFLQASVLVTILKVFHKQNAVIEAPGGNI